MTRKHTRTLANCFLGNSKVSLRVCSADFFAPSALNQLVNNTEVNMLHEELSGKIINAYFHVYNSLGVGFLEKVYENSLRNVLRKGELQVEQQKKLDVYFEGDIVGEYYADLVVNGLIILELKASSAIIPEYEAQLINYLKGTSIELGLLFNFGTSKPEFVRRIFSNENKINLSA